jgi:hypothetical protein
MPSHCASLSLTLTDVMVAPSPETVKMSVPRLALPLISIGPLNMAPGAGATLLAHAAKTNPDVTHKTRSPLFMAKTPFSLVMSDQTT